MKPIAAGNADDWQANVLLVRSCAESGEADCRNSAMAHAIDLYARGLCPANTQQYLVERVAIGENTLRIFTSLVPWGHFNIYNLGQIVNAKDESLLRITLESDDLDQKFMLEQDPKQASEGVRRFSYDGYRDNPPGSDGNASQTHFTYKLFDGKQPSYEAVRAKFVEIASGSAKAMMSSTKAIPAPVK